MRVGARSSLRRRLEALERCSTSLGFDYPRPDDEEMNKRWAKVEEILKEQGYEINEDGPGIIDIESL